MAFSLGVFWPSAGWIDRGPRGLHGFFLYILSLSDSASFTFGLWVLGIRHKLVRVHVVYRVYLP